jgi:opacity protein-like surface antigen
MKRFALALLAVLAASVAAVAAAPSWCLGMSGLGPIRAGMTVEQVMRLADFSGLERKSAAGECWYLHYRGGSSAFDLMIIGNTVVRLELKGESKLHTFSGAHIGTTEEQLKAMYGSRLDIQPHKYDEKGHTITLKSSGGDHGLRFETSSGRVTAIQAGPWEHLNYVEGCS